jgi:hypothetical protein
VAVPDAYSALYRIRGFLYALEMLGVMNLSKDTGFKYLKDLDNFARRYPHMDYIVLIDRKIRTEVDERIRDDQNLKWPKVFESVLAERPDFWATVPCEIMNDRRVSPGYMPVEEKPKRARSVTPEKTTSQRKNALQRERKKLLKVQNQINQQGQSTQDGHPKKQLPAPPGKGGKGGKGNPVGKGAGTAAANRVPEEEWKSIQELGTTREGEKICAFYNCTNGCTRNVCRFKHWCVKCGSKTHGLSGCAEA